MVSVGIDIGYTATMAVVFSICGTIGIRLHVQVFPQVIGALGAALIGCET